MKKRALILGFVFFSILIFTFPLKVKATTDDGWYDPSTLQYPQYPQYTKPSGTANKKPDIRGSTIMNRIRSSYSYNNCDEKKYKEKVVAHRGNSTREAYPEMIVSDSILNGIRTRVR